MVVAYAKDIVAGYATFLDGLLFGRGIKFWVPSRRFRTGILSFFFLLFFFFFFLVYMHCKATEQRKMDYLRALSDCSSFEQEKS